MIARLWSCSAPATISDAEAEPPLIITIKGWLLIKSPFDALYLWTSDLFLPLVDTISPLFKKMSLTFIDCVNKPPGFDLKSSMKPICLFSNSFFIDLIDFINPSSVCSVN